MDATQLAGLLAFGSAALACLVSPAPASLRLALINACFAAECALGWRHRVHDQAITLLGDYYKERNPLQIALTAAALLAAIALLAKATRRMRREASPTPMLATGLALALFAIETISLHAIDRLLYHPMGPLLAIGWLWIALGSTATTAAIRDRGQPNRHSGSRSR